MVGASSAVTRHALDVHGGEDVVTAAGISLEIIEQIPRIGFVPQVMMRVADRQGGLDGILWRGADIRGDRSYLDREPAVQDHAGQRVETVLATGQVVDVWRAEPVRYRDRSFANFVDYAG